MAPRNGENERDPEASTVGLLHMDAKGMASRVEVVSMFGLRTILHMSGVSANKHPSLEVLLTLASKEGRVCLSLSLSLSLSL